MERTDSSTVTILTSTIKEMYIALLSDVVTLSSLVAKLPRHLVVF